MDEVLPWWVGGKELTWRGSDLWSGKIPCAAGEQPSPCATPREPVRYSQELLSTHTPEPVSHNQRSKCEEKPMHRNEAQALAKTQQSKEKKKKQKKNTARNK